MALNIGMSVPGLELGLGTDLADDAEEERRKRMRESQQARQLPGASAPARALGLMPGGSILGMGTAGGIGRGY